MAPEGEGGLERILGRILKGFGRTATAVLGVLFLAAASGVLILTQTATGRRAATSFLEGILEDAVHGQVTVGPVTAGNLLTRVTLDRFRIASPEGETFLELRNVRVTYSPLGLLRARYHLRELRADSLFLRLHQRRDRTWNYEELFGEAEEDTTADGDGTRLWLSDGFVASGSIVVRTPWEPDEATAAAADSAAAAALAGESTWRYERTAGGIERVIRLEGLRGRLPYFRILEPERPMRLELEDMAGRALVVTQDLTLERLDAAVDFSDTIHVDLPVARTAHTSLSGEGWVLAEDPPRYRFDLDADRLGFADLRWLPVPVPDSGGGPAAVTVRTTADPEVLEVDVREAEVRSGDSRAEGGFTVYLEETPRLAEVDVELRPLRLALAKDLLDRDTMPDGLVRGTVRGAGPIDLFDVDADVTLEPLGVGGGATPSGLRARGGIGLVGDPRAMRDLHLEFDDFALDWTRVIEIDTRQPGRISGTTTLDRASGGRIGFQADVRHALAGDTVSHVVASGFYEPGDPPAVALNLRTDPLSLRVVDPYFPALDLVGRVRGPATLSGTMADLTARADLETPRGRILFAGTFDLAAERKRYDAELTARGIQLQQWLRDGPDTRLDVRGRVRGAGTDPATLEATFDLAILPSSFEGARVDSSLLRFSVSEGLARVDTFSIRSDVGTVRGRGGFGLAPERSASLFLDLDVPELAALNRWVVPGREDAGLAGPGARDLFADFPAEGEDEGTALPDTLSGTVTARGVLYGNTSSFGFGGRLDGRAVAYGDMRADSLRVTVQDPDARALDSVVVAGTAWQVSGTSLSADSATFRVARIGDERTDVRLRAVRGDEASVSAAGEVLWSEARKGASIAELSLGLGSRRLTLTGPARVTFGEEEGLAVSGLELVGDAGGLFRAEGTLPRSGPADLRIAAERIPLGELRRFLDLEEPEFGGVVGLEIDVGGTGERPEMEGTITVDEPSVQGRTFERLSAELDYSDRALGTELVLVSAGATLVRVEGTVRADLSPWATGDRLADEPLDLTVGADSLPLSLPLLAVESLREVEGVATGTARVRGSFDDLRLDGQLRVRDGAALVPALGIRLERVGGRATLDGSEARVDSLFLASSRGGSALVEGTIGLEEITDPTLGLDVRARGLRGIDQRRASLDVDGSGRLEGSYRSPDLTGRFRLSDGSVQFRDFLGGEEVVDLTDPDITGLVDTMVLAERRVLEQAQNPFLQNLRADVELLIGPDLWLRSSNLNVEIAGDVDLRMDRAEGDVRLFGDVRLVRGTYRWTGARGLVSRQLRIQEGRISFVGTPGMNPNLDITALHRIRTGDVGTLAVTARVTGTMLDPTLALTSDPPMSESDQVCVLLINAPCGAPGAGQLARDQLLGRLGAEISTALASEVGADYLEVRSIARRTTDDDADGPERSLFSEAEVEAGWYLSPELFLTVTYPFGRPFPEGSLDWRFTDQWTLELLTELRFEHGFRSSSGSNLERDRTWGMFLFREWSF